MPHKIDTSGQSIIRQIVSPEVSTVNFIVRVGKSRIIDVVPIPPQVSKCLPPTAIVLVKQSVDVKKLVS